MVNVSFKEACRNCLLTDGVTQHYMVKNANENDYKSNTEFKFLTKVENWRKEDGTICQFCSSTNLEVTDISINNDRLYDYDLLVDRCNEDDEHFLMFNIDKRGKDIKITQGGHNEFTSLFYKTAIFSIVNLVEDLSSKICQPQIKGNFFISLTGSKTILENGDFNIRIECFRNTGLTKNEIFKALKPFANQVNESCNFDESNPDKSIFKGAIFNNFFYADSLENAKKNGYSYSNVYFEIDDNTLVFHGCDEGSPRDFMDKNKNNLFEIDYSRSPLKLYGKNLLFSKKK